MLVEGHNNNRSAIRAALAGLIEKNLFAFFQRNRINDGFALNAFQAGFNNVPFRAVDHNRDAGNVRFGCDKIKECGHGYDAVEHAFIHINIDDLCAVLDLLPGNFDPGSKIACGHELTELGRAGDICPFADIYESLGCGSRHSGVSALGAAISSRQRPVTVGDERRVVDRFIINVNPRNLTCFIAIIIHDDCALTVIKRGVGVICNDLFKRIQRGGDFCTIEAIEHAMAKRVTGDDARKCAEAVKVCPEPAISEKLARAIQVDSVRHAKGAALEKAIEDKQVTILDGAIYAHVVNSNGSRPARFITGAGLAGCRGGFSAAACAIA
ncbi:MAG: Uncharacterised protein [Hyphomonas sp. TMED17]|nr:MAG: Uncharacterised protein [Hyphomonas sp. TMED17]